MGISVTLSSPSSSVQISQTAQFTAVVQNSSNTAVTWQVDSVTGGSFAKGTITSGGLYTAPQVIPNPNTVTVTAVSMADPTKSASAAVTLTSSVAVGISPPSASVVVRNSQLFLASVTNAVNVAVTWEVNGIPGGDASTIGSIGAGVYIAPSGVPSPNTVTITAVSIADPSKFASATVTILPGVGVSVSPFVARVLFSSTQQFNAAVQNTGNTSVIWEVNGIQGGNSTVGTISGSGLYSAPTTGTDLTWVLITATSVADPTQTAGATAILTMNSAANSKLSGRYAFHFEGFFNDIQVTAYPISELGSFDADGAGNVTAGTVDTYQGAGKGPATLATVTTMTGAYTVLPDNRGILLLVQNTPVLSVSRPWIFIHEFALGSFSQAVAQEGRLTTAGLGGEVNGSGELAIQDSTAFSPTAIHGDFSFGGRLNGGLGVVGTFHADGAGNFTNGFLDTNGTVLLNSAQFAGSYTIDANGRGTGLWNVQLLGGVYVTFYVVSAKQWFFLGNSLTNSNYAAQAFQGRVSQQSGGPFSVASLNGNAVFRLSGFTTASQPQAEIIGGIVTADGKGNLNGVFDQNIQESQGVLLNQPLMGSYTVTMNGRGTFNFQNESLTMYMVGPNTAFLLQPPPTNLQMGTLEAQTGSAFSDASVSGNFYFGTEDYFHGCQSGVTTADGAGNLSGTVDLGTPTAGTSGLLGQVFTATYSMGSNGRGTMIVTSMQNRPYVLYMLSLTSFVAIDAQPFTPSQTNFFFDPVIFMQ